MNKKAIIVTAETNLDFGEYQKENYLFIGVERGALDLMKKKIPMTLVIGDFDKITPAELILIKEKNSNVVVLNHQKDFFDGEAAIKAAQELGAQKICFVANPTKRYDKNIGICELIWKYDLFFFNEETQMFLLKKGKNILDSQKYPMINYVSFLSNCPTKVSIDNMVYNIKDCQLAPFATTCFSNAFIAHLNSCIITDHDLLCIMSK